MKNILSTILLLLATVQLFADDGGTSNFRDWTYGNIYVKEPNDKIALRKELMEVDTDSLKATFVFENTTDEDVVVDCAFPIQIVLQFYREEDTDTVKIETYNMSEFPSTHWTIALGEKIELLEDEGSILKLPITISEMTQKLDKKLKKWTMAEYKQYLSDLNLLSDTIPFSKQPFYMKGCDIVQDDDIVPIENVAMQTEVRDAKIFVTFHFHHKLTFPKKKESLVVVSYDLELLEEDYKGYYRSFVYDISTGGTWKDSIESFIVVTPFEIERSITNFEKIDSEVNIYCKRGYEPQPEEQLNFSLCTNIEFERVIFPKKRNYNSEMSDLKVSADILDSNNLNDGDIFTYISTEDWRKSWIEFSLREYVVGPLVVNGLCAEKVNQKIFKKEFRDEDWGGLIFDIPCEIEDTLWRKENRVKQITLTNTKTSESFSFNLSDEYTALASSRGWETSNCVKYLQVLEPGTYRMNIKDIYKVKSATRTGISEMWFFPIPNLIKSLQEDSKSESPIFYDVMNVVNANLTNKPFRGDLEDKPRDEWDVEQIEKYLRTLSEDDDAKENFREEHVANPSSSNCKDSIDANQTIEVKGESAYNAKIFITMACILALIVAVTFIVLRKKNIKK